MHQQLLDLKLGAGILLTTISGVVASSPVESIILQFGALGILGFSIFWMFKVIVPQFLNRMFDSHADHVTSLRKASERFHDELTELSRAQREHASAMRELVNEIRGRPCQSEVQK